MSATATQLDGDLKAALAAATDTIELLVGEAVNARIASSFARHFAGCKALVVADSHTFKAAGQQVQSHLQRAGLAAGEPLLLVDDDLYAEYHFVEYIREQLQTTAAVPVAVGSGTINDLVKLAAYECGRSYLCVATAASVDGYTAYGASITKDGLKQTFFCPAPRCVLADLDVIAATPMELNAAGYGDLLAKIPAGADWLVADLMGFEAIDGRAWSIVQGPLRASLEDPGGVARGDRQMLDHLVRGLMCSGLAIQVHRSSRPAAGAEHQFSHLWDMQHHKHEGATPLHGFKVAVATLASVKLYEQLLDDDLETLKIDSLCARWPDRGQQIDEARAAFDVPELSELAAGEVDAKFLSSDQLRELLAHLIERWPMLRQRLRRQLIASKRIAAMLQTAGCPVSPQQIGIDALRMRRSFHQARLIRNRFTILDLAYMTGRFDRYLDAVFRRPW
ncbi:MAG: sn-glycerol-1-phosphate dehydrogenase [Phycisphaeraceae bacterium]|nr:sn-glycerol-1-phosphate dehydrogenase [Phycisphaeraceae bacterium]